MQRIEQIMAATSGTAAGVSWVSTANEYLQLIATGIAIVAGLLAIWTHFKRRSDERKRSNDRGSTPDS